jgi:hypothetical protein
VANSSNILTYVLVGGAAYLAYTYFTAPTTVTATTPVVPPPTPAAPTAPVVAYIPPTQVQQLQNAAGAGVSVLNADQWSYYWQQLGLPTIDGTKWSNVFFPNGRPAGGAAAPTMSAQDYISALQGAGLAGYQRGMGAVRIAVPIFHGRGFGKYDLGDLRRAGGR